MAAVRTSPFCLFRRRPLRERGFTLIETMATISIVVLMLYVTVGSLDSLRSTSRLTAAQNLISAFEEARSEAMRRGTPCMLAFREKADEFGIMAYREFGLMKHTQGESGQMVAQIEWRQMPSGIALWKGLPSTITAGTNVLSLTAKPITEFGVPTLYVKEAYPAQAMVFGDLGEAIQPSAQSATPVPGPYYIAVAEARQMENNQMPVNYQMIEIRPATGRALLLP